MAETIDRATGKNLICFGAPGTGKSHSMTKQMESIYKANGVPNPTNLLELPEAVGIRTTFHPDSDYSTFVGCYKPRTTAEHQIEYHFQPQAFVNAYVNAWCTNKPYFLVIEEINRGNCAQIFGDLFQVLDRKPDGEHEYSIKPDADLRDCIKEEFKNKKIPEDCVIPRDIKEGKILYLPKNLTLLATMNTSDQSLFPMDSAFKRRWEWCYMPIKDEGKNRRIEIDKDHTYDWYDFLTKINEKIENVTESDDKQLGYWFVKVDDEKKEAISKETFVYKVLFYLWMDVFKDMGKNPNSPFTMKEPTNSNDSDDNQKTQIDNKLRYYKFKTFINSEAKVDKEKVINFLENLDVNLWKDNSTKDTDTEESENDNSDTEELKDDNNTGEKNGLGTTLELKIGKYPDDWVVSKSNEDASDIMKRFLSFCIEREPGFKEFLIEKNIAKNSKMLITDSHREKAVELAEDVFYDTQTDTANKQNAINKIKEHYPDLGIECKQVKKTSSKTAK